MISLPFGWSQDKWILIGSNVLFGVVLIALSNHGVLPLGDVNFFFFSFVVFLSALYRPGWAFLFLVGMLPYETVNLAPEAFGITLRPYQWLALLLMLALLTRFVAKKLPFDLFRWRWFDTALLIIPFGGILSAINAPMPILALKQALIVLSFLLIYYLGRVFLQLEKDVRQVLPFFLGSSVVVFAYALWQNVRFLSGAQNFEVMAGRPNSTFSEADWLGMFMLPALGIVYAFIYRAFFSQGQGEIADYRLQIAEKIRNPRTWLSFLFLVLAFVVLIITVARSAWLGAAVLTVTFCLGIVLMNGVSRMKEMPSKAVSFGTLTVVSLVIALGLVIGLHLTSFQLGNRAQSVGSGLQKITVACEQDTALPEKIGTIDDLAPFGCRHIDLEDIETNRQAGYIVKEVFRNDPNVSIRRDTYGKVWEVVREHPFLGIGWGSVAVLLGTDEQGRGLNASNMFLEVWLGSGLVGLIAFAVIWFGIAVAAATQFFRNGRDDRLFPLLVVSTWTGITVFNLFNSGILLGFFFMYLVIGAIVLENNFKKFR